MIRWSLILCRFGRAQMRHLTNQIRRLSGADVSDLCNQINRVAGLVASKALEPPILERKRRCLIVVKWTPRFASLRLDSQPLRNLHNRHRIPNMLKIGHILPSACLFKPSRFLNSLQSRSKKRIVMCFPSACEISLCMPEL